MSPFLELSGLAKSFGEVSVLSDISLDLGEGEMLALVGPSGSGKTTLLRLLAGFETPDRGHVRVGGEDVTHLQPAQRAFGMVFQHYALFPHMTVTQNVAFGLEAQKWPQEDAARRIETVLDWVDLGGLGGRRVSEISGGQQQRVALARALAPEPRVLLLDEPLSNLDPSLRERTRRELRAAVRQVGITTVLVTHEQEEAFHLGDRVAVLHRGRLAQVGSPEELYRRPTSHFVAAFVGRASILPGILESGARVRLEAAAKPTVIWQGRLAMDIEAGQAVDLVIRPESLALQREPAQDTLTGEIAERRYTGPSTLYSVRLPDGEEIEVLGSGEELQEGAAVQIGLRKAGPPPHIFPRENV